MNTKYIGTYNLAELYRTNPVKACKLALRRTANTPEHERLEAINKLIGGHGTEGIRGDWQNGYWGDIVAAYVNMGDTYNLTVMHVRGDYGRGRFIVTTWGNWVECNGDKYGVR